MTSNPGIVEHFLNFMASFDESKRHLVNEFLESKKYKENKDGFNKAMMHILGDVNKENIHSNIIKKRTDDFYNESDFVLKWFRVNYDPCEITEDPDTYLTIDEIFSVLKQDDFYKNVNKYIKHDNKEIINN